VWSSAGGLDSNLQHLAGVRSQFTNSYPARKVIGPWALRELRPPRQGPAAYSCLYNPGSDQVFFQKGRALQPRFCMSIEHTGLC